MTHIGDILNADLYAEQLDKGNVRVQSHPEFPELRIANYTEQAAFNREWNDVTRTCRGLIWNSETGEVLARPFAKFFNLGEPEAPVIDLDAEVMAFRDKADGSLGIVYPTPDGDYRVATRGSFASEQARLGTKLLRTSKGLYSQAGMWIEAGYTPLFEIVGPDNRIVLEYDRNHLIPLGYVEITTGAYTPV